MPRRADDFSIAARGGGFMGGGKFTRDRGGHFAPRGPHSWRARAGDELLHRASRVKRLDLIARPKLTAKSGDIGHDSLPERYRVNSSEG